MNFPSLSIIMLSDVSKQQTEDILFIKLLVWKHLYTTFPQQYMIEQQNLLL